MRRKPFTFQAAQEKHRRDLLAQNQTLQFAPTGRTISFTPSLSTTDGGTGPSYTLTAGSSGKYVVANNLLFCWMDIVFATFTSQGTTAAYSLDLPVAVAATQSSIIGRWRTLHGAGQQATGDIQCVAAGGGQKTYLTYQSAYPTGTTTLVGPSTPFIWASPADEFHGFVIARVPDGFNA